MGLLNMAIFCFKKAVSKCKHQYANALEVFAFIIVIYIPVGEASEMTQ
jgi:hypothetical protein